LTPSLAHHATVLAAIATLLGGCGAPPELKTYVLGNQASRTVGVQSQAGLPVIELRTVAVPDYLDSTDILRQAGANQLVPSSTGKWGERLSMGLTRALAAALSARLDTAVVTTAASDNSHRLLIEVESFEIGAGGRCLIAARWQITTTDGHSVVESERGTFSDGTTSIDDAAVAAVITHLVDELAGQIALTLQRALARGPA
jgi:uncharacterized lipoprotein YmbA